MNSTLKGILDFGPLLIFFIVNMRSGIIAATAAFMVAIFIALALSYWQTREVSTMQLVTAVVVLIFGGMTVLLQDETFIKRKPTIINALFGLVLLGGLARGKALLKVVLGPVMEMQEEGWKRLSLRWGWFFLAMAVVNEIAAANLTTDQWFTFKVFGFLPLTLIFTMTQLPLMKKYAIGDSADSTSG